MQLTNDALKQQSTAEMNPVGYWDHDPTTFESISHGIGDTLSGAYTGLVAKPSMLLGSGLVSLGEGLDSLAGIEGDSRETTYLKARLADTSKDTLMLQQNAAAHGTVNNLLYTASDMIGQFIGAGKLTGSNLGAATLTGTAQGAGDYFTSVSDGVDPSTAAEKAAITGVSVGIGGYIPASLGFRLSGPARQVANAIGGWKGSAMKAESVARDIALTTSGNVVAGVGQRGLTKELLERNGYSEMAKQYEIYGTQELITDGILSMMFGAVGKYAEFKQQGQFLDAALAKGNELHQNLDTAPGAPVDVFSMNKHNEAFNKAFSDILNGRSVDVGEILKDTSFIPKNENEFNSLAYTKIKEFYPDIPLTHQAFNARINSTAFADRIGKNAEYNAEGVPTFENGTAYSIEEIQPFYERYVKNLPPKSADKVPDVSFSIGRVDGVVADGLSRYLKGYHPGLSEIRIDSGVIKHIHDSRPSIANDVLGRLGKGILEADEVLPNHQNMDRALVVLKHVDDEYRDGVTVLEVRSNGTGTDVITSMVSPERSLKKARELKAQIDASRSEGQQPTPNGFDSPHPVTSADAHAEADFLHFNREDLNVTRQNRLVNNDFDVVNKALAESPDMEISIIDDNGNTITGRASDLLNEIDNEIKQAQEDKTLYQAAAACMFRNS